MIVELQVIVGIGDIPISPIRKRCPAKIDALATPVEPAFPHMPGSLLLEPWRD
ncbi:hypothetical protein CGMCC3_g12551 [Colletotrichum fructicola]|nr:uncharacterized protein CGMCC3_g12551 [Colletotrichum fructicola]KAE9571333.1 hypothetical protein CGMCC3_g12551 [Colletotrichum fructicola]